MSVKFVFFCHRADVKRWSWWVWWCTRTLTRAITHTPVSQEVGGVVSDGHMGPPFIHWARCSLLPLWWQREPPRSTKLHYWVSRRHLSSRIQLRYEQQVWWLFKDQKWDFCLPVDLQNVPGRDQIRFCGEACQNFMPEFDSVSGLQQEQMEWDEVNKLLRHHGFKAVHFADPVENKNLPGEKMIFWT